MKSNLINFISLTLLILFAFSCNKEPYVIPQEVKGYINTNQVNLFDESLLIGDWVKTKSYSETYINGERTDRRDLNHGCAFMSITSKGLSMFITYEKEYDCEVKATWKYIHNYLIVQSDGSVSAHEILELDSTKLVMREKLDYEGLLPGSHEPVPERVEQCFAIEEFIRK